MNEIIFPKSVKKGDKIAIISPAGAVEEQQLEKGLLMIEQKGFEPVLGEHLYTQFSHGYNYAGTEKERISDLNWAFNDEDISAIWTSRGGYGCQHLLGHLQLSKFKRNPKWYIGYSDNTVIQSFLLKNNFASINGQTIKTSSFGVTDESYDFIFNILQGKKPRYYLESNLLNKTGRVDGQLIGGNLALVYALLGSPYSFDFKDKILFIEEIGEKYYALDRMLISLELAGVFRKIKGLIIGGMINMGDEKDNKNYEESFDDFSNQIISERIKKYNFPTLFGFPNGHILDNKPLIIGANIKLVVEDKVKVIF
ncbi:S66 peptidase family protein [Kaistella antarctica]|uniref:Murein tetrapeptide carboxypeptidase n=1 Tax=Kaistella antarctica TaxID=266748 RepID=A0A3S4W5A4_9FLAO|nr:LD-carboxypeptidase [Kaistella antarctica]KEY18028.1 peptidase U61 [Kaistella antarctica]SEV82197.1 muramoyltetrapeptide carboxypeptidase [Kaistella antarctica]VEI00546.1 Murein tetrapeptide carboxypeptidase [Kaistella antarctica]